MGGGTLECSWCFPWMGCLWRGTRREDMGSGRTEAVSSAHSPAQHPHLSWPALDNSDKWARDQSSVTPRLFLAQLPLGMIFQGNVVQSHVSKSSNLTFNTCHQQVQRNKALCKPVHNALIKLPDRHSTAAHTGSPTCIPVSCSMLSYSKCRVPIGQKWSCTPRFLSLVIFSLGDAGVSLHICSWTRHQPHHLGSSPFAHLKKQKVFAHIVLFLTSYFIFIRNFCSQANRYNGTLLVTHHSKHSISFCTPLRWYMFEALFCSL